jgi:hypothetical protein
LPLPLNTPDTGSSSAADNEPPAASTPDAANKKATQNLNVIHIAESSGYFDERNGGVQTISSPYLDRYRPERSPR